MDDKVLTFPARDEAAIEAETPLVVLVAALQAGRPGCSEDWLRERLAELQPRLFAAVKRVVAARDRQWARTLEEADPVVAKKVTLHLPGGAPS